MAKSESEEVVTIPKRRFERIIREAKETSAQMDRRIQRVQQMWEDIDERRRERRRLSG